MFLYASLCALFLRGLAACLSLALLLAAAPARAADDPLAARWQAYVDARNGDRPAEARAIVDELAARGYPYALAHQAQALRSGAAWYGGVKDYPRAFALFERAWAAGNPSGAHGMGYMHLEGEGRPQDPAQALAWFRKGADGGLDASYAMLGLLARNGRGMAQDCAAAERHYLKAIELGGDVAKYNLALLYDQGCPGFAAQPDKALQWMRDYAKGGDETAKAFVAKREAAAPPAFQVRPLPGPSPERLQLFNGALRAAAQMGFKADEIDNENCSAQLRHNYQGRAVVLHLAVPVASRVRGSVVVADDAVRAGFIQLYRKELAKQVGTSIDLDGNISER